ncbi:MAG: Fic family protein [Vulcanimicrobiota bacterium]
MSTHDWHSNQDNDDYYLEGCLDQLLIQEFGIWIAGWRSSEDGGPVVSEIDPEGPGENIVTTVLAAVQQWREFLEEFDGILAEVPMKTGSNAAAQIETVAARLVPMIIRRTETSDAWYRTCALTLNWYLEASAHSDRHTRALVEKIFSGHFHSWTEPTKAQIEEASRRVGEVVGATMITQEDSLEVWLNVREPPNEQWSHFWRQHNPLRSDGHVMYIKRTEKDEHMLAALTACRKWADSTQPLTFEVLTAWQKLVLNKNGVHLRETDAFAKNGRERYGVANLSLFDQKLAEANDTALHPIWRAAMAYLDCCFFHPFADGNARLARLVADAVLWRNGLAFNYVEPAFVIARNAQDDRGGTILAITFDRLIGRRGRTP